ncbi:MAG: SGNH/GDSL hydrolase family protein [Anaerolineae bacterium]|nr:SGNH/GDSL hydrolase family protein [Anaerolineae bacterium]
MEESIHTQPSSSVETTRTPPHPLKLWAGRLAGIVFGLGLAWLLVELMMRLFFFSLPPRWQLVLHDVRVTPFTDRKLLPDPIWQSDIDYLTINRAVQDYDQFGSAEVHYTVNTETLWGGRVAFRTRQALVDQHVDGVAVGDSFTFCFTDEDDCWVQRLSALTGRNVINMGITSTGSTSHQRVLETFGMPLAPPLVIWQWFGNDANEDYGLALLRGETDIRTTEPAPKVPKLGWWDKNSAVYVILRLYFGPEEDFDASLQFYDPEHAQKGDIALAFGQPYLWSAFDMSQPHNAYGWERSQAAFLESQEMVSDYGGTLLIVLMPTKEQVYRDMAEPLVGVDHMALLDEGRDRMLAFCEQENLTCFDPLPVLQAVAAQGEQLYFTTDMHLNARGNDVLAEALAGWLDDHPDIFAGSD